MVQATGTPFWFGEVDRILHVPVCSQRRSRPVARRCDGVGVAALVGRGGCRSVARSALGTAHRDVIGAPGPGPRSLPLGRRCACQDGNGDQPPGQTRWPSPAPPGIGIVWRTAIAHRTKPQTRRGFVWTLQGLGRRA